MFFKIRETNHKDKSWELKLKEFILIDKKKCFEDSKIANIEKKIEVMKDIREFKDIACIKEKFALKQGVIHSFTGISLCRMIQQK